MDSKSQIFRLTQIKDKYKIKNDKTRSLILKNAMKAGDTFSLLVESYNRRF